MELQGGRKGIIFTNQWWMGGLALGCDGILVGPMTYFAHRGLAYYVLSSKPGSDSTEVVEEHFGPTAGKLITSLYFLRSLPILLIYGNGTTNTADLLSSTN